MAEKNHLYLLWTNDNKTTAEKMVFMYATNALIHGWWEKVTLIIWGATAKLTAEDKEIQNMIKEAMEKGMHVTACKACTDQLDITPAVKELGVEIKYWGLPLTDLLKNNETLLTV